MTDLHTHILPGMDDGARDTAQSIALLKLEWAQGIRTVALTPHFYPEREPIEVFLARRGAAYEELRKAIAQLPEEEREQLPQLILGAEVAWIPGLADMPGLERLCYEGSRYLLVELPFLPWSERLILKLNDLMNRTGLTPVIAHVDRYLPIESKKRIACLCELGLPMQLSAEAMKGFRSRRRALRLIRLGAAQLLISDCHNTENRRPNLAAAYEEVRKRLGEQTAEELKIWSKTLLKKQDCLSEK